MQVISVSNLNFSYNRKLLHSFIKQKNANYLKDNLKDDFELADISFDIDESSIFSILGPNGSGKSTLLKILAKILNEFDGKITFYDKDITRLNIKQYSKIVHFIPQNPLTNIDFNVLDTIVTGANPELDFLTFPSKKDYEKAKSLLKEFDLSYLQDKSLMQISGGEAQLVFFLRALMNNSKILILDEPTAFLDFKNQFKILDLIQKISLTKKTIIISLHDPNHVIKISDKVLLLKSGKAFKIGEPDEVLNEKTLSTLYDFPVKQVNGSYDQYFFKI